MKRAAVTVALIFLALACSEQNDEASNELASNAQVGSPCSSASECPAGGSGAPVCLEDWPSGYCAVASCADHGHDCPGDPGNVADVTAGSKCVLDPAAVCLALCAEDDDCREGYVCAAREDAAAHAQVTVCVPRESPGMARGDDTSNSMTGNMAGSSGMPQDHAGSAGEGGMSHGSDGMESSR